MVDFSLERYNSSFIFFAVYVHIEFPDWTKRDAKTTLLCSRPKKLWTVWQMLPKIERSQGILPGLIGYPCNGSTLTPVAQEVIVLSGSDTFT